MCFGNDSPPQAPQIQAPPREEIMDFIDEISGTQTITVTGADGKKRRVTQQLPRTPEEEELYRAGQEITRNAVQNIQTLYKYDPASMIDFAPLIETFANINNERMHALAQVADIGNIEQDVADFKDMQRSLIDEQFAIKNRSNEETLAHMGRGTGTYAAESRAAMAKNETLARQQGDIQGSIYGEELAAKRLGRNKEAFNLQEMGRQGQLQSAEGKYALAKEHEADIERRRQRAIEENKGLMNVGSSITGADLAKRVGGQTAQLAAQDFQMRSADSIHRYNADVNRQQTNYAMAMEDYKNQPPTFGEWALNTAGSIGGSMLTANPSSMAGRLGKKFVG
jgi:hypothetical protein